MPRRSPGGIEGMAESGHLVQNASEGPYVGLVIIRFIVEDFRRHVVRRSDTGTSEVHRSFQHLNGGRSQASMVSINRRER